MWFITTANKPNTYTAVRQSTVTVENASRTVNVRSWRAKWALLILRSSRNWQVSIENNWNNCTSNMTDRSMSTTSQLGHSSLTIINITQRHHGSVQSVLTVSSESSSAFSSDTDRNNFCRITVDFTAATNKKNTLMQLYCNVHDTVKNSETVQVSCIDFDAINTTNQSDFSLLVTCLQISCTDS